MAELCDKFLVGLTIVTSTGIEAGTFSLEETPMSEEAASVLFCSVKVFGAESETVLSPVSSDCSCCWSFFLFNLLLSTA
jgi:hypothetical protein